MTDKKCDAISHDGPNDATVNAGPNCPAVHEASAAQTTAADTVYSHTVHDKGTATAAIADE